VRSVPGTGVWSAFSTNLVSQLANVPVLVVLVGQARYRVVCIARTLHCSYCCMQHPGYTMSMPTLQCREKTILPVLIEKLHMMSKDNEKLQIFMFAQHTSGVSKALWPAHIRRIVATDRAAQRRRSRIASREWEVVSVIPGTPGTLETPVPSTPTRVRVLETVDLSSSNVEHFLDTLKS